MLSASTHSACRNRAEIESEIGSENISVRIERAGGRDDSGNAAGSYQWRDNSAEAGKAYWYSIEMVKGNGEKQQLTGSQKIVAK